MSATDWRDLAYCRDDPMPDLWHVSPNDRDGIKAAKAMCAKCPVASDCLAEALADADLTGVWGGTTADERKKIRKPPPRAWRCGTSHGHRKHRQLGEESCEQCTAAAKDANRRYELRRGQKASA